MQEAERYPTDFDGIIAGAPALDWVGTMTGFVWERASANARRSPSTRSAPRGAVLAACDAKDGLKDGLITDRVAAGSIRRSCSARPATRRPASRQGR